MSKVLGIIAEYNPFHNGHLYHIKKSIEETGASSVICVMSGNFVQRGNTSIVDKWTKTKMALANGVDLVLELPTIYSVSSAENFAEGAIRLLDSLKIVDTISFGMEAKDIASLNNIANVLYTEPKEYTTILEHELRKGVSFPKARENAVIMYLNDIKQYANILTGSNNILAIEYLKAIKKLKSKLNPIGIRREKVLYNDEIIIDDFASATAIRKMIATGQFSDIQKVMPKSSYALLADELRKGHYVLDLSKFQKEIIYNLRKMSVEEIAQLVDVSEGLENAIKNAANSSNNLVDFVNIVKSKRYTQTRIQRILIYALLGITNSKMLAFKKAVPYARVLGFNENGKQLISQIAKKNKKVQIVTSVKKYMDESKNKVLKEMLETDILATNVYTLGYEKDSWSNLDYTNKLVTM
ncbi:MAG TPA: nucleotidyltransferase [Clostridiales bacterium]|nr:nucleotidyltransferase [Clostridiales bacterium]